MAPIAKIRVAFELNDGTTLEPLRVLAADKIATESTCRKRGWEYSDGPRAHTLMGYFAARRAGVTAAPDYPAFMEDVADYVITNTADDDADAGEGDDDPTPGGSGY